MSMRPVTARQSDLAIGASRGTNGWTEGTRWPRKEKSLAKPRSGGETPSRTESSCPAWRSRAN